ncbi:zinc finger protein Xfin-like [Topomyia yanbarensis]|uniref:zinc finger protein Xfin-like n=1 Tax=Topomyia yanbarensis TaxID=2498891 RepID=UPI00273C3F3E|nr:zinc finger protein Xfin-like [Topomyia yanbarensis]
MAKCCIVPSCGASSQDFGTVLFCFPNAEDLRKRWTKALGKAVVQPIPESAYVCWSHFESKAILKEESGFRRLEDAVPVQYLGTASGEGGGNPAQFCRFCAKKMLSELLGNNLNEMNRSEDSRKLLCFLLPGVIESNLSYLTCDECFVFLKLMVRFMRNCDKATRQLENISLLFHEKNNIKLEITTAKSEVNDHLDCSETVFKLEVSDSGGFSDRDLDDTDAEDNVPLANLITQKLATDQLKCLHCSFTCAKRNQMASHMKKHRNIMQKPVERKPITCPECPYICSKPNQLAGHWKKHKQRSPSRTEFEDSNESAVVKPPHKEVNERTQDVKPIAVDSTDGNLSRETNSNNLLQCPDCPYSCERIIQLASHKKKHSSSKRTGDDHKPNMVKDFYECEFCDFTCKLQRQMAGHRASHSNQIKKSKPSGKERDHMCSICGKILSTRGSFFVHMKYHNDQRDYSCTMCERKFYSKRDVTMHMQSFHEKKVFECKLCGVKCTWKNALYKHMRKHDSRSFKHECSYCGKKFIAANELRLHVWRHTGQQLTCDLCGAGYRFNFLLTQHKIREHGIQIEGVKLYKRFKKDKKDAENPGRIKAQQTMIDQMDRPKEHPTYGTPSSSSFNRSSYPPNHSTEYPTFQPPLQQQSLAQVFGHVSSFQNN